jgi:hypothetical protein
VQISRVRRRPLLLAVGAGATVAALAAGMATSAFAATVFSDTFSDGNADGWSKSGGTWSVADGALTQSSTSSELARQFAGQTGWTDYQVQARVRPTAFGSSTALVGLAARASSSTKMYRLALLGSGRAELQAVNGSQLTSLGSASIGVATGTWYTLRIEASGSTIRGYVNGTQIAAGSNTMEDAGRIALVTAYAAGSFDDVAVDSSVTTPPTTGTPPTSATPTSATPTSTTSTPPPTSWPTPTASVKVDATIAVSSSGLDGGLKRYYGIGDGGQSESQDPMFELAPGATLRNVIIGAPAGDGVHCLGNCTLINVWWEDVGEDAATFLGGTTYTVDGGGARSGSDKVFQHNGPGTVYIKNFRVESSGKLYRACGNCSTSYQRHVVMDNITATGTKVLAGINTNWGDTARFTRITILNDSSHSTRICVKYKGVPKGSEPTEIGSGADGVNCIYSESDITWR